MKNHKILYSLYAVICLFISAVTPYLLFTNTDMPLSLRTQYQSIILVIACVSIVLAIYGYVRAIKGNISVLVFHLAAIYFLLIIPFSYHDRHCEGKFCNIFDYFTMIFLASLATVTLVCYFVGKLLMKKNILSTGFKVLIYLSIFLAVGGGVYAGIAYFLDSQHVLYFGDYGYLGVIALWLVPIPLYGMYILKIVEAGHMVSKE